MNVLLLNDTRVDPNPGCHATVHGLLNELAEVTTTPIATRPRGDGYQYFAPLLAQQQTHSLAEWDAAVTQLCTDRPFRAALDASDLVVANLEGTFHHHTVGALALGGALSAAHRLGKRVWAVNGSIEAIAPWLLQRALSRCELVSVREPRSHRWLDEQGVRSRLAADCAFLTDAFQGQAEGHRSGLALYTPGALAGLPGPRSEPARAIADMKVLAALRMRPVYFQVDADEEPIAAAVLRAGWEVLRADGMRWHKFVNVLKNVDLVVSGRYHILIFAAMAGVPIVAKPSNTWKIEGVMEMLRRPRAIADSAADLDRLLAFGPPSPIGRDVIDECCTKAHLLAA